MGCIFSKQKNENGREGSGYRHGLGAITTATPYSHVGSTNDGVCNDGHESSHTDKGDSAIMFK